MDCRDFKALWQGFCDEELSADMHRRFLAHREECAECRQWDASMRALEQALDRMGDEAPEPPPFLVTRIMAHISEIKRPHAAGWLAAWADRFRLPRLAGASLVVLAFLAGLGARDVLRLAVPAAGSGELAVRKVVIEYKGAAEQEIGLVGDFNEWGKRKVPIAAKQVEGRTVFEIELAPGRYEYAFLINGKKWLPDPEAAGIIPDGFGGLNSVMYVRPEGDETL